jgi:hypothetical protein
LPLELGSTSKLQHYVRKDATSACLNTPAQNLPLRAKVVYVSASAIPLYLCQAGAMARGWESKSVESQIESAAEFRRTAAASAQVTAEQATRERERTSLQLSRTRVLHDLQTATHARYREQLEAALRHLDSKLAAFE